MANKLYKVGDKVRIKDEIFGGDRYDQCYFAEEMEVYKDQILTIKAFTGNGYYRIKDDDDQWSWTDGFFEPVNAVFVEGNVVLLRNGQIRLVHDNALYLPDGKLLELENYTDRKHNFDENFDIIEVHRKSTGNYLFELSGELIQEEK